MFNSSRPNGAEKEFLTLAYNKFYDLFNEIFEEKFWQNTDWYRFSKIKEGFAIYTELLNYPPIQWVIEHLKKVRPPMEAEIGSEVFRFIRNVLMHFPFFDTWADVYISKQIVNWYKNRQSIDSFLEKYKGKREVKYRIWEEKRKKMTYLSINFPKTYTKKQKIYLKDVLTEKEGIKFAFILMRQIIDTQVIK